MTAHADLIEWEREWLTDPANRRAVILRRVSDPSAYFRDGWSRRAWRAMSKAQRRAVLDRTAPVASTEPAAPRPPIPTPADLMRAR
ncbi:hypothetical protein FHX52_1051 [Humibacillus xanthopallidus]|uniref:Uncharacterized protein n=1 Tax=Humibacillus xanthopallidus TaxID=412689 RepID=A0A543PV27_9MICO|nr:hypothetical protein [Humibacillus xanthopallidus]TQN47932.1 hypothetical protein FHX52_1051 [Humibacillus xanthopallidus]